MFPEDKLVDAPGYSQIQGEGGTTAHTQTRSSSLGFDLWSVLTPIICFTDRQVLWSVSPCQRRPTADPTLQP